MPACALSAGPGLTTGPAVPPGRILIAPDGWVAADAVAAVRAGARATARAARGMAHRRSMQAPRVSASARQTDRNLSAFMGKDVLLSKVFAKRLTREFGGAGKKTV